jgi:hypothetical protein
MHRFLICFLLASCRQLPTEAELAACSRAKLERELTGPVRLRGSAVENGRLKPGMYLFSSTYLALRTDASGQQRFNEVMGPIQRRLDAQPGLLASSATLADSCAVARTFSVWADEASMYSFVGSEAHAAAVRDVALISRGGSVVTNWRGTEADATWERAAEINAADPGPEY